MSRRIVISLFLVLITLIPVAGLAWSALGHQLVGELAQRRLNPKTAAEVAVLLKGEPDPSLAGVATWADALRSTDPELFRATSRWHYINASGGGCGFDLARDCPDGNCAVAALERETAILGDRSQPLEARRDALKWVVHLVGDLHQPLHANSRTDAGGNRFQISLRTSIQPEDYARRQYVDGVQGTNLHSVWDFYILANRKLDLAAYANALAGEPQAPFERLAQTATTPLQWAEESCRLTEQPGLYPPDNKHKMTSHYLEQMRPLAEQRVEIAAIRLADLLNRTLGK
ncbi:MAG: S1/P1 nuclease [Thermomonas sp.]|uniref:S1/P1 nuclease n=1 Tax=Thermomonas sp. TaxID=1971895 RepID=UPI001DAAB1D3|nr:S1/P1 nuclease [Thermomonas sp.]MBZ0087112.1 S1/P1 nuclease [Thermomonas sp.]